MGMHDLLLCALRLLSREVLAECARYRRQIVGEFFDGFLRGLIVFRAELCGCFGYFLFGNV